MTAAEAAALQLVSIHSPCRLSSSICVYVSTALLGAEDEQGLLGQVIAKACKLLFRGDARRPLRTCVRVYGEMES